MLERVKLASKDVAKVSDKLKHGASISDEIIDRLFGSRLRKIEKSVHDKTKSMIERIKPTFKTITVSRGAARDPANVLSGKNSCPAKYKLITWGMLKHNAITSGKWNYCQCHGKEDSIWAQYTTVDKTLTGFANVLVCVLNRITFDFLLQRLFRCCHNIIAGC